MLIESGVGAAASVLGSILIDASCLSEVREEIRPSMFPLQAQADIFSAACALQDAGEIVDPVTIGRKVQESGGEWSSSYALQLMEITPTSVNVREYCKVLRTEAMARALEEQVQKASDELQAGQDPFAVAQDLTATLEKVMQEEDASGVVNGAESFVELLTEVGAAAEKKPFVTTGYSKLDKLLGGGFVNGRLYIMAARPGNGKTTLAMLMAESAARSGKTVLFVSLEMTREELNSRRIAAYIGDISADRVLLGDLSESEMDKVTRAATVLSERRILYNRRSKIDTKEIQFLARQNGADLVVIDYLGLIQHGEGKSLYERVTATSGQLKQMALILKRPVLCLAQLNREVEGRNGQPPRLSDLRDSGAIEQDANVVMLLHRIIPPKEEEEKKDWKMQGLDLIVAKNRHGKCKSIGLSWALENGRIVEGVY